MATLSVCLNGVQVGWLEALDDYYYCFVFDAEWLADPRRPVLGQLFEDRRPQNIETSGMLCWFAHILPQGALRRLIARSAGVDETEDFEVLTACGGDLPGAVTLFETESRLARPANYLDVQPERDSGCRLGFSLAGNQWKLSVRQGERGLVVPTEGENAEWIAKFNDPEYPRLPRVEYATTLLARRCGLEPPDVRLVNSTEFERLPEDLPVGDGSVFLSRRFDRRGSERIHMEDIAKVLQYLDPGSADAFVAQLAFCAVIGNGDAHLKNFSLQYIDGRTPRLSPAYDLVPTILYVRRETLALSLGGTRSFCDLNAARFSELAAVFGRAEHEMLARVSELVNRFALLCRDGLEEVGFNEHERRRLTSHIEQIARQFPE
jgi:serine/threonine-protein kinase HipA